MPFCIIGTNTKHQCIWKFLAGHKDEIEFYQVNINRPYPMSNCESQDASCINQLFLWLFR